MKKNEYKILIVFLIVMSCLIVYLGWMSMQKCTIDVTKKTIYQKKRVKSEKFHVESIIEDVKIPINNHANDKNISIYMTEDKESKYSIKKADSVGLEQISNNKQTTKSIEAIDDEILARDEEEAPVDLETVEDLELLGYSSEEAQRIIDEDKRVRKNPNMSMPLSINPKIIEDMRILGYSKEEAQKIINENMNNPEALERILVNIDRGLSDLKMQ